MVHNRFLSFCGSLPSWFMTASTLPLRSYEICPTYPPWCIMLLITQSLHASIYLFVWFMLHHASLGCALSHIFVLCGFPPFIRLGAFSFCTAPPAAAFRAVAVLGNGLFLPCGDWRLATRFIIAAIMFPVSDMPAGAVGAGAAAGAIGPGT